MRFSRAAILAVGLCLTGTLAHAVPVSGSQFLDFQAGKQSLWGPGGLAGSFSASGSVGNSTLGFQYDIKASSGTVERASFDGFLNYSYQNGALVSDADVVNFSFAGSSNGGLIDTLFGASLTTEYKLLGGTGCIYCRGASIDIDKPFTPSIGTAFSGSDSATTISASVGPSIPGAEATAGVDIDMSQTSTLTGKGIHGQITAVHQGTGATRNFLLDLTNNGQFAVDLGLDQAGIWDVSLTSLVLDNEFFSSFTASLVPFAQYYFGLGCGDLSTDSDNGLLCGGDGRASWNLANISLGQTQKFGLSFNSLNLSPFSISVVNSVATVPEPGAISLLGAGILALSLLRRRTARRR